MVAVSLSCTILRVQSELIKLLVQHVFSFKVTNVTILLYTRSTIVLVTNIYNKYVVHTCNKKPMV